MRLTHLSGNPGERPKDKSDNSGRSTRLQQLHKTQALAETSVQITNACEVMVH